MDWILRVISFFLLILSCILLVESVKQQPNIIFILVDDVGWADFSYNVNGNTSISTPNIDRIADKGIKLKRHYAQPTCTPSRASLLTGRYATNTGLNCAMFPGSPVGLPADMPTMPQLLRKAGYSAHMVGKWHLGHSQWKQTPVGRGFESHTGSYLWDIDYYEKSLWKNPFTMEGYDWVTAFENGSYVHNLNHKDHATQMHTKEAIKIMEEQPKDKPLFLYLSYNAAHSPLKPDPVSASKCAHIPHLWRRQYCGLVVGLDTAVGQIYDAAKQKLGDNTVIVLSSDNGGAVWFGALNQPLRGWKLGAFEGGVRVPAFAVDLSGGTYLGEAGREFHHKMHISDWLPTMLSWANKKNLLENMSIDGIDHSAALASGEEARKELLIELYTSKDSHSKKDSEVYIKGKYKLINGNIMDPNFYEEPDSDGLKTSDISLYPTFFIEKACRCLESIFGETEIELVRNYWNYVWWNNYYSQQYGRQLLLYDLENDPREENNIASKNPDIVNDILATIESIKIKRPKQAFYWMVSAKEDRNVKGNCNGTAVPNDSCLFIHPWLSDGIKEDDLQLVNGVERGKKIMNTVFGIISAVIIFFILFLCLGIRFCLKNSSKTKRE